MRDAEPFAAAGLTSVSPDGGGGRTGSKVPKRLRAGGLSGRTRTDAGRGGTPMRGNRSALSTDTKPVRGDAGSAGTAARSRRAVGVVSRRDGRQMCRTTPTATCALPATPEAASLARSWVRERLCREHAAAAEGAATLLASEAVTMAVL